MVQFRPQAREIIAKIVYYGPPLGGKTTNLRTLYKGYPADTRGELVVVPAGGDRTIFFDFLPLDAGSLRGMKLRVQLYTVPGQVHYNATRQIVLRGVDAVVFVADSQRELMRSNRDSWEDLKNNLLLQGLTLSDLPHVLQYNKRDLSEILSVEELDTALNEYNAPFFEVVATVGIGVEETLQNVVKLVARSLRDRFKLGSDTTGLPADLVAMPPMDELRVTTGSARVTPFPLPRPGGPIEIPPFGGPARVVSARGESDLDASGLTSKVKVTPVPVAVPPAPAPPVPEAQPLAMVEDVLREPQPWPEPADAEPALEAALVDAASQVEPERLEPTAADVFLEPRPAPEPAAEPAPLPVETGGFVAVEAAAGDFAVPVVPLDDPFAAWEASGPGAASDDVFAMAQAEAPPVVEEPRPEPVDAAPEGAEALLAEESVEETAEETGEESVGETFEETAEETGEVPVPEPALAGSEDEAPAAVEIELPPEGSAAIQRAVPRALAQMGEVRELEVEVPVPSVWTGGRRMTLQLRLTLVPQQDQEGDGGD